MRKRLSPTSIVTGLLLVLAFPVFALAGGGGSPSSPPYGSPPGKTTATIVGDAVQFRPCTFGATFAATDPDDDFDLFQKASGDFPTYHSISGNTLVGDSTCDNRVWTSTVWAVDEEGTEGTASDPLVLECRIDRDDIPTDPIFSIRPRFFGSRSQPTATGGSYGCCFTVTLSSSTPGGERDLEFEKVSGDLPPGHSLSGDTISGCTSPTHISGGTASSNDVYVPPRWVSKWRVINRNNRCEVSGISTLTLTCGDI